MPGKNKAMLRHARIQTFCALAGLLLVLKHMPEFVSATSQLLTGLNSNPPAPVSKPITVKTDRTRSMNDITLAGSAEAGSYQLTPLVTKYQAIRFLEDNGHDAALQGYLLDQHGPADQLSYTQSAEFCEQLANNPGILSSSLPTSTEWLAAKADEKIVLQDGWQEWILDPQTDGADDRYDIHRPVVGGKSRAANHAGLSKLGFRCNVQYTASSGLVIAENTTN